MRRGLFTPWRVPDARARPGFAGQFSSAATNLRGWSKAAVSVGASSGVSSCATNSSNISAGRVVVVRGCPLLLNVSTRSA